MGVTWMMLCRVSPLHPWLAITIQTREKSVPRLAEAGYLSCYDARRLQNEA